MPRTPTPNRAPTRTAPKGRPLLISSVTGALQTAPNAVRLQVPWHKGNTADDRRAAHALVASVAYRIAAEIMTLNLEVGAAIAMPDVTCNSDWDATVTVEGAETDGDCVVIMALIADACSRVGVSTKVG
jgi:hypothetical protein